jgi:hypothetical protein
MQMKTCTALLLQVKLSPRLLPWFTLKQVPTFITHKTPNNPKST